MSNRGIFIDRKSPVPLHRQLESALRAAILSGTLLPGERVLSSRDLQTHLGLGRNTVLDALDQLTAEGYLVTRRGVGTFVAPGVQKLTKPRPRSRTVKITPSETALSFLSSHVLAQTVDRVAPFRPGVPAFDAFPSRQFKRSFDVAAWTPQLLDYTGALGHEPLRAAIARRLRQTRGIVCAPGQVLITAGAQFAFSLIAQVMLNGHDTAIVEDPGYSNIRATLQASGANVVPATVDECGIKVASFQRRRAKLVYITPAHQYPTGAVLSLERRFALLDWAARHDAWIVEDDYDSEFVYTDHVQPALQGLDDAERVIYVGTFSKVLSPAIRVAYIVVPRSLCHVFEAAQEVVGGAPSTILQAALATFMENGDLGRHITKMRKKYDERRHLVSVALAELAGSNFHVDDSRTGLHLVAHLPESIRDADFTKRAAARGIVAPALSSYFYGKPTMNGVVIGYAATPASQIKSAVAALVSAL